MNQDNNLKQKRTYPLRRNGIEPLTYGFSDRRSTTELPTLKRVIKSNRIIKIYKIKANN